MRTGTWKKAAALAMAVAVMTGCLAGCGSSGSSEASSQTETSSESASAESSSAASETSSAEASSSASAAAAKTEYPLTVTFYGLTGEETCTYEKAPEKALVIGQSNIETMMALGLEDRILAVASVDGVSDFPEEYQDTFAGLNNLDVYCPDEETIVDLEPDFIYSAKWLYMETSTDVSDWTDRGINCYVNANWCGDMESPKTLENEYQDILTLGEIFDVQDRAEELVAQLREGVAAIEELTDAASESPSVMIIQPMGEDGFMNYYEEDLAGVMTVELGGTIAVPDSMGVSKEEIVDANPDVIIVLYSSSYQDESEEQAEADVLAPFEDEAYANVAAVANGRVYAMQQGRFNTPGAGTYRSMLALAEAMYPDIDFSGTEPAS